jgi:CBS domain-containing protein
MKVRDIIATPVATLTLDSDVGRARDLMTLKKISSIPIVNLEDDVIEVEGIVSFQDLVGVYDDSVKLVQVMSRNIYAVTPETTLQKAAEVMMEKRIHHLIVMEQDQLVGIISALDFVKLVAEGELMTA